MNSTGLTIGQSLCRVCVTSLKSYLESKPTCLKDMLQELREHQDSITFLDIVRDSVPAVKDIDLTVLPTQMQRLGYYASIQGNRGSVCSKSKNSMTLCCSLPKQHRCSPQPI